MQTSLLPLWEQLLLNAVGPLVTVVLGSVAVGGTVSWLQKRREARQALRDLTVDMFQVAFAFYTRVEDARRRRRYNEPEPSVPELEAAYQEFAVAGRSIEARLRVAASDENTVKRRWLWHCVIDVLTLLFFHHEHSDQRIEDLVTGHQREHEPARRRDAVGRRSLAVSSGLLELFLARRLGDDQIVAVLVHELGHHATGATRYTPATSWLAAPWRIASRLMIGIPLAILGRRQPKPLLALVLTVAVVRGVQQLIAQHQWAPALLLATTAAGAVVCPLAHAALSRSSEYAADRYAADRGAGSQLAAALQAVESRSGRRGWAGRALATHPGTDRRVEALSSTPRTSRLRLQPAPASWRSSSAPAPAVMRRTSSVAAALRSESVSS